MDKKREPKEPIHIRRKKLKNGSISLYLDSWLAGRRHYEFLRLYLIPEKTRMDRELNKSTLLQAQRIKTERTMQLQRGGADSIFRSASQQRINLSEACLLVAERKKEGTAAVYRQLAGYVQKYSDAPLQRIDRGWIEGFLSYLSQQRGIHGRTMAGKTQKMYFGILHAVLQQAVRDGLISANPCDRLAGKERPKAEPRQLCYLTMQEVRRLAETPCKITALKQAFLFACFTGLRYGDLRQLCWKDIQDGHVVKLQQKTGDFVRIPISNNADRWLPKKGEPQALVWELPRSASYICRSLSLWAEDAGIEKHITFHTSRHTAATLWLTYGVDIYTCSRLLGHASIATTQIYAQVVDKKKLEAVNSVPDMDAD